MERSIKIFLSSLVIFGFPANVFPENLQKLEVLYELELPAVLNRAYEVRWYDSDSILVPSGRSWAAILDLDREGQNRVIAGGLRRIPVEATDVRVRAVARSSDYLAVSDLNHGIAWKTAGEKSISRAHHHGFVMDFDLHEDKVILLGHHLMKDGSLSREGEIAWLTSLSGDVDDLKPVLYSQIKASEDTPMGKCGWLRFGGLMHSDLRFRL